MAGLTEHNTRMTQKQKDLLDRNRHALATDILDPSLREILSILRSKDIFTRNDYDTVLSERIQFDRVECLLDLLVTKGSFAFHAFKIGLRRAKLPSLVDLLEDNEDDEQDNCAWIIGNNIPRQPLSNDLFVGRSAQMKILEQNLKENKDGGGLVPISAMPGCGKSCLAAQYALNNEDYYEDGIFWVFSSTEDTLEEGFAKLYDVINPGKGFAKEKEDIKKKRIHEVSEWLRRKTKWLLIFDSADDDNILRIISNNYLPKKLRGHVIITTPIEVQDLRRLVHYKDTIKLERLNEDDAVTFFTRYTSREGEMTDEEKEAMGRVVSLAGGLPLALAEMAAYVNEKNCTFTEYYNTWDRLKDEPEITKRLMCHTEDDKTISTVFNASFRYIAERFPSGHYALQTAAFCNGGTGIPLKLFILGQDHLQDDIPEEERLKRMLAESNEQDVNLRALVTAMRKHQLISVQGDDDLRNITFVWNPLVQDRMRESMTPDTKKKCLRTLTRLMAAIYQHGEHDHMDAQSLLLPHAKACVTHMEKLDICHNDRDSTYIDLQLRIGACYSMVNKFEDADKCFQKCVELLSSLGTHMPRIEATLNLERGKFERRRGNEMLAIEKLEVSYEQHKELSRNDCDLRKKMATAEALEALIFAYVDCGGFKELKGKQHVAKLEEILKQMTSEEGVNKNLLSHIYGTLGRYYQSNHANRDYGRALEHYNKANDLNAGSYRKPIYNTCVAELMFLTANPSDTHTILKAEERCLASKKTLDEWNAPKHRYHAWNAVILAEIQLALGLTKKALGTIEEGEKLHGEVYAGNNNLELAKYNRIKGHILRTMAKDAFDIAENMYLRYKYTKEEMEWEISDLDKFVQKRPKYSEAHGDVHAEASSTSTS